MTYKVISLENAAVLAVVKLFYKLKGQTENIYVLENYVAHLPKRMGEKVSEYKNTHPVVAYYYLSDNVLS